jgi:class 3 adenylate cyclase
VVAFTALGDTVNTASRLASSAASGEILMSEAIYARVAQLLPSLDRRTLLIQDKEAPMDVRVLGPGALGSSNISEPLSAPPAIGEAAERRQSTA